MLNNNPISSGNDFLSRTLNVIIKIGLVLGLIVWCFFIIKPFVMVILWGMIIAITLFPFYRWLKKRLGNRRKLASVLVTLLMLLIIFVPFYFLGASLFKGITSLKSVVEADKIAVPPPSESVKSWPLVGNYIFQLWDSAANNPESVIMQFKPQIKAVLSWMLSSARNTGVAFILFVVSIIVAGILLAFSDSGGKFARELSNRLMGARGNEFAAAAEKTIRNVSTGILGVAFIQAVLAGIGFLVAGVPGAGLWTVVALFFAIIQLGIFPVSIPIVIYLFFTGSTITAIALLIWCTLVGLLDNVLKPLLLGRGSKSPMLVIFLGAIGGFLLSGFIGLFVGAVILSLGYDLFMMWLRESAE